MSSALPPGATAPELRARAHGLLKARPELREKLSAQQLSISEMGPQDAEDLAELQEHRDALIYKEGYKRRSCFTGTTLEIKMKSI